MKLQKAQRTTRVPRLNLTTNTIITVFTTSACRTQNMVCVTFPCGPALTATRAHTLLSAWFPRFNGTRNLKTRNVRSVFTGVRKPS